MAGPQRCPFLQSWQSLHTSPLGLLPHEKENPDYRRVHSGTTFFWKDMEDTIQLLESELDVYTRGLPAENTLGIPTGQLLNKVLAHTEGLNQRREAAQDFLPRKLLGDLHHPIWLVNRLLEEVKPPPPFIPTLTRQHSFS